MGVVFAYRVVANKPSIREIHKKKKKNERQRQIAWGMGGTNPSRGFLFPLVFSLPFFGCLFLSLPLLLC